MALSASIVWEVRTAGSDSNGGGFKSGATGTDYSVFDAAQFSGTDLVVDAVTNTKVTSATHNFVAADVGNVIQITAGSGWTTGFYEITSVASNAATLDRSPAATGTTGGTWAEGGALASPGKAAGAAVAANDIWIKSGTYTISSTTANVSGGKVAITVGGTAPDPMKIEGYQTTRGDKGTRPVLQVASSGVTAITVFSIAGDTCAVDNIEVDGQSKTSIKGFDVTATSCRILRCRARNCTNNGIAFNASFSNLIAFCDAIACSGAVGISVTSSNGTTVYGCEANACTSGGFSFTGAPGVVFCLAYGCTGIGFDSNGNRPAYFNCVAYNNSSHGFNATGNAARAVSFFNCIATNNGGWGWNTDQSSPNLFLTNCAGYSNTSGNYNSSQVTNVTGFVTLTASPFTNAASGDFSLNNTSGGGAACRAAGTPGAFPGGTTTGYLDVGAAQHQDSGGSAGVMIGMGMAGGMRG